MNSNIFMLLYKTVAKRKFKIQIELANSNIFETSSSKISSIL